MNTKKSTHQTNNTNTYGSDAKTLYNVFAEIDDAYSAFMAPDSFQHITLNTGHSGNQSRESVNYDVANVFSQIISEGLANSGWTDLKRFGESSALHVSVSGTNLLAKLYLPCKVPKAAASPALLVGISAGASPSNGAWKYLHAKAGRKGSNHFMTHITASGQLAWARV